MINKASLGTRLELTEVKFASVSGFTTMELAGALLKSYNGDLLRKSN